MATKNDKPCNNDPRQHNAPLLDPNHKPTGLKEAALADWNRRLIVGRETVDGAPVLPTKPL